MAPTGNTARIEAALLDRLKCLDLRPKRRVAWPGAGFAAKVGEIYLAPGILWNATERRELGAHAARRHVGIFQVNVRGPALAGDTEDAEVADAIIEHFDRQVINHSGVVVRIGSFSGGRSVPWRTGPMVDAGWRLIPVSIPFWCDIFPTT